MTAEAGASDILDVDLDRLVDAALPAVRAIAGVAVRSLEASPVPVTVAQYRVLLAMAQDGPVRPAVLAATLGVDASTVTRMCDRLVRDGLIVRRGERADRRAVRLALSSTGRAVVDAVRGRRREQFRTLLQAIPSGRRTAVVAALQEVGVASEGMPTPSPAFGWIV